MENVFKLLSKNKDCRLVIIDTEKIAKKELNNFTGDPDIKEMLQQTITSCALFAAINDFYTKISFSFRFTKDISLFCEIKDGQLILDYKEELNTFAGDLSSLITHQSVLSITTGDWNIGLHTGTVEITLEDMSRVLAHFTVQSDQLPSHFIFPENLYTKGILLQPLPFANKNKIENMNQNIQYLSSKFKHSPWSKVPNLFENIGDVIWKKTLR